MKKFFKWVGIVMGALIALPIAYALLSIPAEDYESIDVEFTEFQNDSVEILDLEAKIKHLEGYTWPANNIVMQYADNEVKADEMFRNKRTTIVGKIKKIGKDAINRPYLILDEYEYSSLQCIFDMDDTKLFTNLKKGQKVLLKGKGMGKMMHVMFEDCAFIKDKNELEKELVALRNKKYSEITANIN